MPLDRKDDLGNAGVPATGRKSRRGPGANGFPCAAAACKTQIGMSLEFAQIVRTDLELLQHLERVLVRLILRRDL